VLFATHSLDEARRAADRLLVLQDGRVVFAGPPGDYREEGE
jgi:ABC-type multidrug transport system ATPase subunit